MIDDFCIFILSHDRAGNIDTINSLERYGYSGDWYIVIHHEEDKREYIEEYGEDKVIFYDHDEVAKELDLADNLARRKTITFSRYACFKIARDLGYTYFMEFDDDYHSFQWRFNKHFEYEDISSSFKLDKYIKPAIEYLQTAGLDTICMAQGGDFIGGSEGGFGQKVQTKRKAMNTFLCRSDKPFKFIGTMNEDVNTYVRKQQLGKLFLTVNVASAQQAQTQSNDGGITDLYLDMGTYVKSMYTVMVNPSCTTLNKLRGQTSERIHHRINWKSAVPKILPESAKTTTNE